mmetsp:Transcript_23288/g.40074  ORF Transcript_23288/g.40074 Transcript_23288/m.40074 type:complete len:128 (-) Transcript_23288:534-917(-)|eukprot:CAMPEP_0196653340 /NCGR_PEP_ID=MMETSP1086-20130531/2962_1 /TAXON_ID=77921 /ORGANISM="Cyanoptyche  gloeocystis , Strain SAG4.97" /LENGTH=127 /DNA_ID=CAMNT_0041984487 /DNA_START=86 /DNA_END=469 /DNA_ORIENTATION=+
MADVVAQPVASADAPKKSGLKKFKEEAYDFFHANHPQEKAPEKEKSNIRKEAHNFFKVNEPQEVVVPSLHKLQATLGKYEAKLADLQREIASTEEDIKQIKVEIDARSKAEGDAKSKADGANKPSKE